MNERRPLRIAYVVPWFPSLSETFIAGELAELRRRGAEVRVLALEAPKDRLRHQFVVRAGLVERTVYGEHNFAAAVRAFQPDLLHAHYARESAFVCRWLADHVGRPFTFTTHGYDIYLRPPEDFIAKAWAAAAVVTVSEANATHLRTVLGVPAQRIHVIPCGVNVQRFQPGAFKAATPLVVCVARSSGREKP